MGLGRLWVLPETRRRENERFDLVYPRGREGGASPRTISGPGSVIMSPIDRPDWGETASVPAEETEPATHLIIPAETFEPDDDEDASAQELVEHPDGVDPARHTGHAAQPLDQTMLDDWSRSGGLEFHLGVAQGAVRGVLGALPAGGARIGLRLKAALTGFLRPHRRPLSQSWH